MPPDPEDVLLGVLAIAIVGGFLLGMLVILTQALAGGGPLLPWPDGALSCLPSSCLA